MSDEPVRGNQRKYLSYREAWTRIALAQEQGFYLEAVTLAESIISDRLLSHLVHIQALVLPSTLHSYPPFADLLKRWANSSEAPILHGAYLDLPAAVDTWRLRRNVVIHGMVKSRPGAPTDDVADFLLAAREAAADGARLARAVTAWCRKAKRRPS